MRFLLSVLVLVPLAGKRFLLVHATPRDPLDEYATADPNFWAPRLAGLAVDYVCVGHTHQPYTLQVNGITVINPGSVGLCRDGDPRAAYAVLDGNDIQLKRVEYPVERTVQAVQASGFDPTAKQMLVNIYRGGGFLAQWAKNGHANGVPANGQPKAAAAQMV